MGTGGWGDLMGLNGIHHRIYVCIYICVYVYI